jgi:hypothetical protein
MDDGEEIKEEVLQQAEITEADKGRETAAPDFDIEALQKSYRELQSAFTKKAQAVKELEAKINSAPGREEIIREYLLGINRGEKPAVITSSSSAFDFTKIEKPKTVAEAYNLAREYFSRSE